MKQIFLVTAVALLASACTNDQQAKEALSKARYYDIEITGYSLFGCDHTDFLHTGFKAKNAFGEQTGGVVCSSPFNDHVTIRQ